MSVTATAPPRIVVVTGGASGLGEAIVHRFAADGDRVVIADVDEGRGRQVADNLTAAGLAAESATLDVTSEGEVAAMFDALAERHGRLDALICSAAIETRSSVVECTDDEWQRVLDVNVKGVFLCCKHGIPAIAKSGGGAVVLLGSVLGAIGSPGYAAYCASKGALTNLAKQAAIEHAADGVRVNVVSPSATDTGLFARVAARSDDPEGMMQMVATNTPMKRLGTAREVADTVAFLCSRGAGFISGAVIPLDGGMAARRIV
jgi:meso-butanediol dehydrogenase / (S,S)-butanediol dehydrogenase / diacetyl reductase